MSAGASVASTIGTVGADRHHGLMQLARLAATSADIAATRSRLAKRRFIAQTIAASEPQEIELVVTFLSGSLRQRRNAAPASAGRR